MTIERAQGDLRRAKHMLRKVRDMRAGGRNVRRTKLIIIMSRLDAMIASGSDISELKTDPTHGAKFTNAETKIAAVRDWIFNNFPRQGRAWLVHEYGKDGVPVELFFTPAQLDAFITAVDEVLSA